MTTQDKRLTGIVLTVALVLIGHLIAMQFTSEVNWTGADFLTAGVLLLGTGLVCELIVRKVTKTSHRVILCGIAVAALFLIWAELAVGLFGTPFGGS